LVLGLGCSKEGLNKELGIDIPVKLHQPVTL
jgi:hypothetical protein